MHETDTDDKSPARSNATATHLPDRPRRLHEATPEELAAIAMLCVVVGIPTLKDVGPPPEGHGRVYVTLLPWRPARNGGDVLAEPWVYVGQQGEKACRRDTRYLGSHPILWHVARVHPLSDFIQITVGWAPDLIGRLDEVTGKARRVNGSTSPLGLMEVEWQETFWPPESQKPTFIINKTRHGGGGIGPATTLVDDGHGNQIPARMKVHVARDSVTGFSLHATQLGRTTQAARDPVTGKSLHGMRTGTLAHAARDPLTGKSILAMNNNRIIHAARDLVTGKSLHTLRQHVAKHPVTGKSLHAMRCGAGVSAAWRQRRIERERNTPCLVPFDEEAAILTRLPSLTEGRPAKKRRLVSVSPDATLF